MVGDELADLGRAADVQRAIDADRVAVRHYRGFASGLHSLRQALSQGEFGLKFGQVMTDHLVNAFLVRHPLNRLIRQYSADRARASDETA